MLLKYSKSWIQSVLGACGMLPGDSRTANCEWISVQRLGTRCLLMTVLLVEWTFFYLTILLIVVLVFPPHDTHIVAVVVATFTNCQQNHLTYLRDSMGYGDMGYGNPKSKCAIVKTTFIFWIRTGRINMTLTFCSNYSLNLECWGDPAQIRFLPVSSTISINNKQRCFADLRAPLIEKVPTPKRGFRLN